MSRHRGQFKRDAMVGPGTDALTIILKPEDARLMEKLLMHYANEAYFNSGPEAFRWRGYSMRHDEARELAAKIKRTWAG